MLQINNACIEYGHKRLFEHLTLHVQKGEMLCITGESGSGKTSLLRAVLGFVPLKKGEIRIDGIPLSAKTIGSIRQKIAYIPQELSFPSEWVREMIQLPFDLKANQANRFSQEKLLEYFHFLGLEKELLRKRVCEISGGQKQRVMIAISALLEKPLFIIDEPTSALDKESSHRTLAFFQNLARKGRTIIVISHDQQFASGCNRIFTL